jgi:glycosyltransferase involved in cell wall biosynthesis
MRVLQLLDTLERGGAETLVLDVCRNASRHGIDAIFATSSGGELLGEFQQSGVRVYVLKRTAKLDFGIIRDLRSIIKKEHVEIVHAHQAMDGLHVFLATTGLDVARILSFHGYAYTLRKRLALRYLVPRVDANIAVSDTYLKSLLTLEPSWQEDWFKVLHNGIDVERIGTEQSSLRAELGLDRATPLFGMIGNFGRWKDQATICRGLPSVFHSIPRAHFVFTGDSLGSDTRLIEECKQICVDLEITERVHFLGRRMDVGSVLRSLDVAVSSSLQDTFGLAPVEAMFLGTPVLLSDIPPFLEITDNGRVATFFHTRNEVDFANALAAIWKDIDRARSKAQAAKRWVTGRYTIDAHLCELERLYAKVLDGRRRLK